MHTTLHSFIDIFKTTFQDSGEEVRLQKIIIPIIQRDYAQGRKDPDIDRVRNRFLDALREAVVNDPITLDFVYGDIDENGVMTPLDGQQRLTTLFLLHWYAAKKGSIAKDQYGFLSNFGYETRYSARYFCKELIVFNPTFECRLSDEIIDQTWFPLDWNKDPTISSMLVMLDAIDDKFKDVDNLWNKLCHGAITFYFLPIKDMGLTDELYIKMNSRGKPLTRFEHFKAELERCMRVVDDGASKRIMQKIDRDWTDMLWKYRNSGADGQDDNITDDEFLRYFHFICDILCYQSGQSPQGKSTDEFDLLEEYFVGEKEDVLSNLGMFEAFFDCWCHISGFDNPTAFLENYLALKHEKGKIVVDSVDLFEHCLHVYGDTSGRQRQFSLAQTVLLYAITCYLRNMNQIAETDFITRLRVVNNLIQNSEDEVSDRADRNRMPAVLKQTDAIIITGEIDDSIENSFNINQIAEEKEKKKFLDNNPDKKEKVYFLEDHPYLYGQISIIGLENIDYGERFASLFKCDRDRIDCALMAIGDYGQQERRKWRWQYASTIKIAWDELFHRSANTGFERTKAVLIQLLAKATSFSDDYLKQLADEYTALCEKNSEYPWRYYYIKYNVFRPGSYGKYANGHFEENPYLFAVMQTKSAMSSSSYMPYLKEVDDAHLDRDSLGRRLVYGDRHIICENNSYLLRKNETEEVIETIPIKQNAEGIDTEDRITVLKDYIAKLP